MPPPRRPRRALASWLLGAWSLTLNVGCLSKVTMTRADGDDGSRPHTVILYSGVHDTSRQYADYTVVDETILED